MNDNDDTNLNGSRPFVRDETVIAVLKPAIARMIQLVGPQEASRHLALAFAGHIAGGGEVFACQMLHFAHNATTTALASLEDRRIEVVPSLSIVKPS